MYTMNLRSIAIEQKGAYLDLVLLGRTPNERKRRFALFFVGLLTPRGDLPQGLRCGRAPTKRFGLGAASGSCSPRGENPGGTGALAPVIKWKGSSIWEYL